MSTANARATGFSCRGGGAAVSAVGGLTVARRAARGLAGATDERVLVLGIPHLLKNATGPRSEAGGRSILYVRNPLVVRFLYPGFGATNSFGGPRRGAADRTS